MTNGSPDWVNAIASSRTTLKVEPLFLLLVMSTTGYAYTPTAKNISQWL
ncbi:MULTISPECIES: hypothetical protein [unclassified Nostoc]|nr:hypothetical protein [Nostoc sp. KVJ20]